MVVIAGLAIWFSSGPKEAEQQQVAPSQAPGTLPAGESRQPLSGETGETQSGQDFHDSAIRVEDTTSQAQIRENYNEYVNQNVGNFPTYVEDGISLDYPINDKNGNMVELPTFLSAVGAQINPQVRDLLGSNYYGFFYCINEKKEKEYGISFDIGTYSPQNLQSERIEAQKAMKSWEPYMLKDLHPILFPKKKINESFLNQNLQFQEGEFLYASVNISGEQESINYFIETDKKSVVNRIYITTSQNCLRKGLDFLFDY